MRIISCLYIGILIICCFAISCRKNERPLKKFSELSVSAELKEWGLYNVGSYWIYKDSITGIFDSVYVESITNSRWKWYKTDSIISEEQIKIKFGSTNGFSSYTLDSHGVITGENYATVFSLDTVIPQYSPIKININISALNVLANSYSQVRYLYVFEYKTLQSSGYTLTERNYMKKHIGIIKRTAKLTYSGGFNQNLELVRYNIIQ